MKNFKLLFFCLCLLNLNSEVTLSNSPLNLPANDNKAKSVSSVNGVNGLFKKIEITGNKRIEGESIAEKVRLIYADFSELTYVNKVIKVLFDTGFFSNVNAYIKNNTLFIHVSENPIVAQYAFEGNDVVSDDNFKKFFKDELKSRTIFSLSKIKYLLGEIINVYRQRGYFSVQVDPKIIKLSDNRVNVVFDIKEGKIATVKKVFFVGNRHFDDSTLLAEMSTKETLWWRFWSSDDIFAPGRIETDKRLITEFYKSRGYANFKLESTFIELSEDKQSFYVTIKMNEGVIYNIDSIVLNSEIKDFKKQDLKKILKFNKNDKFNIRDIEESKYKIADTLSNKGYVFSNIDYKVELDHGKQKAKIIFFVDQGQKAYINNIKIEGNAITKDNVIRRELLIQEQDALQADKVAKSVQNIRDLDFFSNVNVMQEKVGYGKTNLKIKVDEKSTAMLQLNLGFAIGRGVFTKIGLSERNFLGEGKYVSGEVMIGKSDKAISGNYVIPYFLNRRINLGFSAGISESNRSKTTSSKNKSYSLGSYLSYIVNQKVSHRFGYSFSYDDTKPDGWTPEILKGEYGKRSRSSIYSALSYVNLDSRINPRDGVLLVLRNAYYGLGGDVKFVSNSATAKFYFPMFERSVLMLKAEGGIMGNGSYLIDRFSLGGDDIKGFDYDGIGPRIKKSYSPDEESLRGTKFYSAVVALGVPITEGVGRIRSVTYAMLGSNWGANVDKKYSAFVYDEHKLRVSIGTGIEWMSPLGPIALTYSRAIKKQKYDDTSTLQIGYVVLD